MTTKQLIARAVLVITMLFVTIILLSTHWVATLMVLGFGFILGVVMWAVFNA